MVKRVGIEAVEPSPSCYYHSSWKLLLTVYVGDFKMSGPDQFMGVAWTCLKTHLGHDDPVAAHVNIGRNHSYYDFT